MVVSFKKENNLLVRKLFALRVFLLKSVDVSVLLFLLSFETINFDKLIHVFKFVYLNLVRNLKSFIFNLVFGVKIFCDHDSRIMFRNRCIDLVKGCEGRETL